MDAAAGFLLGLLLSSFTWSFSQMWKKDITKQVSLWPGISSNRTRHSVFLVYFRVPHTCTPLRQCSLCDWHGEPKPDSGTRTREDKEPLAFIRWLGPRLICLCHPHDKTQKAFALKGFTSPSRPDHEPHQSNLPEFPSFFYLVLMQWID